MTDPHQPGAKLDAGKPDASLLLQFADALTEVAKVGTFGARKYTRGGWLSVPDGQTRYTAALLRHLMAETNEDADPESGLSHAAHTAWNALARLQLAINNTRNTTCATSTSTSNPTSTRSEESR